MALYLNNLCMLSPYYFNRHELTASMQQQEQKHVFISLSTEAVTHMCPLFGILTLLKVLIKL